MSDRRPKQAKQRSGQKQPAAPRIDVSRADGRPLNRIGPRVTGLWPDVSRKKLAEMAGIHITTVTGILQGRTKPSIEFALLLSKAVGLPIEELNKRLRQAQIEFTQRKLNKLSGIAGAGGTGAGVEAATQAGTTTAPPPDVTDSTKPPSPVHKSDKRISSDKTRGR